MFTFLGCKQDGIVSFDVHDESITSSHASFTITNNSKESYYYGEPYMIEREENGDWLIVNPIEELFFLTIAYDLNPNDSIDLDINWENGYGKLDKGKYRIVKDIVNDNSRESIFAEFEIGG